MSKLCVSSHNNVITDCLSFDCDDDRPTLPVDLAPKSSETYDDLSAHAHLDEDDSDNATMENSDDRPTIEISEPIAA